MVIFYLRVWARSLVGWVMAFFCLGCVMCWGALEAAGLVDT